MAYGGPLAGYFRQRRLRSWTDSMIRQVAILAGGLGTRIEPLSGGRPKSILPVGQQPFLHFVIKYWDAQVVHEFLLLLGHGADEVRRSAREVGLPEMTLKESVETEPLGTGGALKAAEPLLDDRFLMVNGD